MGVARWTRFERQMEAHMNLAQMTAATTVLMIATGLV
jgi:hypothetical protein